MKRSRFRRLAAGPSAAPKRPRRRSAKGRAEKDRITQERRERLSKMILDVLRTRLLSHCPDGQPSPFDSEVENER